MTCEALLAQSYTPNYIAVPKLHDPGPAIVYCDNVNDIHMRRRQVCRKRVTMQLQASQRYLIRWRTALPQRWQNAWSSYALIRLYRCASMRSPTNVTRAP